MQRGIGFKSLQEPLDTTTSSGKLVFHMFGTLAECARDLLRERTQAGLVAARVHSRLGGRPKGLSKQAKALYCDGTLSAQQDGRLLPNRDPAVWWEALASLRQIPTWQQVHADDLLPVWRRSAGLAQ